MRIYVILFSSLESLKSRQGIAGSASVFKIIFFLRNVDSPASRTVAFIWTVGSWGGGGVYFWDKICRFLKLVGSCF